LIEICLWEVDKRMMHSKLLRTKTVLTSALAAVVLPMAAFAVQSPAGVTTPTQGQAPVAQPNLIAQARTSPPMTQSQFDAELLRLTNAERARAGLQPLQLSPQLKQAAQGHAEDMVRNNFFSHTGSNGSTLSSRVRATGYVFSFTGENIAAGRPTPAQTIAQWMASPGHRRNILNRNYTQIGFGYRSAPTSVYRHYWVQVFGTPMTRR
jgi:uncharacterized protein YkwD